jgi:hypothetical protein
VIERCDIPILKVFVGGDLMAGKDLQSDVCQTLLLSALLWLVHHVCSIAEDKRLLLRSVIS